MTPPVEWHDNEPTFPDFLPPKPEPKQLSREEAEARLEGVLEAAGISLDLYASEGGMVDVIATFPDGAAFRETDRINLLAEGYTKR
jgi:hypothetical protein